VPLFFSDHRGAAVHLHHPQWFRVRRRRSGAQLGHGSAGAHGAKGHPVADAWMAPHRRGDITMLGGKYLGKSGKKIIK